MQKTSLIIIIIIIIQTIQIQIICTHTLTFYIQTSDKSELDATWEPSLSNPLITSHGSRSRHTGGKEGNQRT